MRSRWKKKILPGIDSCCLATDAMTRVLSEKWAWYTWKIQLLSHNTISLLIFFFPSCMASVTQASMQMSVRVGDDTHVCLPRTVNAFHFLLFWPFSPLRKQVMGLDIFRGSSPSICFSLSCGVVLKDRHPLLCVSCCGLRLDACFL